MDFSVSGMANGNIVPACAVKGDVTKKFCVIQGGAGSTTEGDKCLGIAQMAERRDPSNSDGFAAIAGEPVKYYGNGAKDVPARLGGSVTAFDQLKAGAGGKLITATTAGDNVIAIAKQGGILDDLIDVDVTIGVYSAN